MSWGHRDKRKRNFLIDAHMPGLVGEELLLLPPAPPPNSVGRGEDVLPGEHDSYSYSKCPRRRGLARVPAQSLPLQNRTATLVLSLSEVGLG